MQIMKWVGIWLAAMVAVFFALNTVGALVFDGLFGNMLTSSITGYCTKLTFPLEPAETEEDAVKSGAILSVRSIMSSNQLVTDGTDVGANISIGKFVMDGTTIFLNPEGRHRFSEGIFTPVYWDTGDQMDYVRHCAGAIDVQKFAESEGAGEIQRVLAEQTGETIIRLNAFSISDYVVSPAKITILDAEGNTLLTEEFSVDGEIIEPEDFSIYHTFDGGRDSFADQIGLAQQIAVYGERTSDRIAHQLENSGNFTEGITESMHYGIMKVSHSVVDVEDGHTGIAVYTFDYHNLMLLVYAILGTVTTAIVIIVYVIRSATRKKN